MIYISFILFYIYLVFYIVKYNIPKSISATFRLTGIWFSLITIISSLLMLSELENTQYSYLLFITISSLLIVGCAYDLDYKFEEKIHTYSAIVALLSSLLWVGLVYKDILLSWILMIFAIGKNYKFWAEVIMINNILLTLILFN